MWSAAAAVSWQLLAAGAMLLVWLPSGIAVACQFATPISKWPRMMAVLAVFQFAALWCLTGTLLGAVGYTLQSQVEAGLCGYIGIRVLGGRKRSARNNRHIAGMVGGAMFGSAAALLVALPFVPFAGIQELGWRYLAAVLGVLAGTPACLRFRQYLGYGDLAVRIWGYKPKPYLALTIAALVAFGTAVLALPFSGLEPLLFVAVVFAVIRYGQMAAACGVLAYAAAAALISFGGHTPVTAWEHAPLMAAIALQTQLLLLLAATLPIAAMLMAREGLQARLRVQNEELRHNLTILTLAESLAGIGRWRFDFRSGAQDWSATMLELNGLDRALAPDPGEVRDLLPDGGEVLLGELAAHAAHREPYSIEYRIARPAGDERILKMQVSNEFNAAGERVALFAVAMDVTEQVEREKALEESRAAAVALAARAQKDANTDALTGLANRRAALDWLERLVRASAEAGEPLSVIMFDIDHFKQINDCFGHATGDAVLRRVAQAARRTMRADDLVGRVGGEEFVCLLPGVDGTLGRIMAERLRHAVAENRRGGDGLPTATVSIGLAISRGGDTADKLLARADAALYEAKNAGRNQVRLAA